MQKFMNTIKACNKHADQNLTLNSLVSYLNRVANEFNKC